mmetsp:Transcript_156723/g.480838  ORF Transcript_156723/g.480838 Transcript_156723/m.480838 type:complete len:138 (+) Transcript_156723:67-480(+)|eukprot:CAMPEP_0204530400 /NCGR_PEP_ID=MMETSP0661-20131031/10602_1 /ASSEMBLY_ACC=CAM_ASM_000606 /TAXON_ID=109239 /ORGANISM="Alexandrium margalefi, Strain AMGDE01CS-322" /LENGTH=137 /DNA_ID=CAMNT_0051536495 /DNA_START=78 /DNA_END=491 /DNA_ORIENTATION=-
MRLLTHNLLQCNKKGVTNGFPLIIKPAVMKYEESEFDQETVAAMVPKLEYSALLKAVEWVGEYPEFASGQGLPSGKLPVLPAAIPADYQSDEDFLRRLHVILFDVHLVEGKLVCPESGREFPVSDRIPNMLLNDDEV